MNDGYMDAAAVPVPDGEKSGDTLRERLAEVLATCTCTPHPYGDGPQIDCPRHGHEKHQADALLPLIHKHTERAVEQARADERGQADGPVVPSDVQVGDVVEIKTSSWRIEAECIGHPSDDYLGVRVDQDRSIKVTDAFVRVVNVDD